MTSSGLIQISSPGAAPAAAEHLPVLLEQVMDALAPRAGGCYLDGTLGLAGHASALMRRTDGQARLCGLDRDPQALAIARERLVEWGSRCRLFNIEYARFDEALDELGWPGVDGALLDLGVSSLQLDVGERGFSLRADGLLDMRMDMGSLDHAEQNPHFASARTLVNRADWQTLKDIIARFGEDPLSGKIARAIVEARQNKPIETTKDLADIVYYAYPAKWRATARNHPATRTFQAVRMAVNDELGQLGKFLAKIMARLNPGGRLAIISFHSLEDRMVKKQFRDWAKGCVCPPHMPRCVCNHQPEAREETKKPIGPDADEKSRNPRSGSAKLRVAEKLPVSARRLNHGQA